MKNERRGGDKDKRVCFLISRETWNEIERIAAKMQTTESFVIRQAISFFLRNYQDIEKAAENLKVSAKVPEVFFLRQETERVTQK